VRLAGKQEREGERELRKIGQLERALGRKTYELEDRGGSIAWLGVRARATGPTS